MSIIGVIRSGRASPARTPGVIPASYFGLNFNWIPTTPWPTIGHGTARLWNQSNAWLDIETARGVYNWTTLDAQVAQAPAGKDVIYTFGKVPGWANGADNLQASWPLPPTDIAMFSEFVTAIVTRYSARIKFWELGNEPGLFWPDNGTALNAMTAAAYPLIKSIDPTATVLSPCWAGASGPASLGVFLDAGNGVYCDVIAAHGYGSTSPENIVSRMPLWDAVLQSRGLAPAMLGGKPVWLTEQGYGLNSSLPAIDDETAFIARSAILSWWRGIKRWIWYAYDSQTWGTLAGLDGTLNQNGVAFGEVYKWMVGAELLAVGKNGTQWQASFTRTGYAALAVWDTAGASSFVVPAQYTQYRDLAGGLTTGVSGSVMIGKKPILFETASAW